MLIALFGFMDLLIFVKWLTNYEAMVGAKPPSVISSMINMCLNFGIPPPNQVESELFDH
jgi:hypothetical protein